MTTIQIPAGKVLDPYFKAARSPGTTFLLEEGTYYTRGCFGFPQFDLCMLAPGTSLIGRGRERTFIQMNNPILEHSFQPTHYAEAITGGARTSGSSPSLRLEGFTLDLGHPVVPTVGIHLWTSKATVLEVDVRGVFGDRDAKGEQREGFGILVNSSREALFDGSHNVRDCTVRTRQSAKENYCCGIYVGCVRRDVPLLRSRILGCVCIGDGPGPGHSAFAANEETSIQACQANGWVRAFFCDTDPVRHVDIANLVATNIQWAVDLRVAKVGDVRERITVRDSKFFFTAPEDGWAQVLLASDDAAQPTTIEGIVFESCQFDAGHLPLASQGRTRGLSVGGVQMLNCLWVGPWQTPITQLQSKPFAIR